MIEKGRHLDIPSDQRLYNACHEIEDQIHFLDKCKKYSQKRSQLLSKSQISKKSDLFLFNNMQNVLAKYVFEYSCLTTETSRRNHDYRVSNNPMNFMAINVLVPTTPSSTSSTPLFSRPRKRLLLPVLVRK